MARERSQRNRRISETERRKARQSRNKQKNRMIKILAAVGMGILAVLIIAGLALPSFGGGGSTTVQDFLDRGGFFARPTPGPGEEVEDLGRVHFDTLSERAASGYYNSSPATSGTHSPTWERCGIFEEPVQDEILVHNLEHGFVNVHYNTTDPVLIGQVEAAARGLPGWPNYYLFAPYPDMDATIALTAWNRVLYLDSVDEDAMEAFAVAYQARGPEVARGCDAPGLMQAGVVPELVPTIEVVPVATEAAASGDDSAADAADATDVSTDASGSANDGSGDAAQDSSSTPEPVESATPDAG